VRTRAWVVAAVLALVVGLPTLVSGQCPDGSPPPCGRRAPLDTARYAILPFAHREGSRQTTLDGAACAELLAEAFARWAEVRLADKTRLYDALARRGERLPFRIPFDAALAIARRLGAGRLVMGQLWSFGDTLRLTAGLYDAARGGAPVREVTTRVPATGAIGAAVNALADSLLGADLGAARGAGAEQTRSLRALRAYALGERAIREWDLGRAAREFRAAVTADSAFARAYLGLGQALLWAADSTPDATHDRTVIARRAAALLGRLGTADGALLLAQQAMFERRWPDACRQYREIVEADSTSFAGWYGLAECNAGDPVVIRDSVDSTRYVFRGSWHTGTLAYRKALVLAPAFNFTFKGSAAERLSRLLVAEAFIWREGRYAGATFFAFPELRDDTVAYYATPGSTLPRGHARPPTHRAALALNRGLLTEITAAWVEAFPREATAHRTLAAALELNGNLVPATEVRSALTEFRAAQRLERLPEDRRRDVVHAIRVLVKAGDYDAARRLGDSLLTAVPRPAAGVAGVAVLLGRPTLATRLIAAADSVGMPLPADNQPVPLPLAVGQAGLALLAYASVAAPGDSISAFERRLEELATRLPTLTRPAARSALLDIPAELVFDVLGLRPAHRLTSPGPPWAMEMQWRLAHGDSASVRAGLDTLLSAYGGAPSAADISSDAAYVQTRLLLAVGDTTAAVRHLDGTLDNLPDVYSALLDYLPLAGCLVRMMALRADLAAARGDQSVARHWASVVVALWGGADPALRPTVLRMSQITQATR